MTSGKLLAFWTESRGTSVDLWHAAFTPGQDWSDPGMLETLSGDVQDPRITGEGDRATLAWRSTFQTGEVLGWVKTFSASSGWGEPGEFARGPNMSDVRPYYDPRNNESGAVWIEAKAGNLASVFFSALR